ncbi:MAG: hypothetical protein WD826_12810 [Actinomycetota bacterium]
MIGLILKVLFFFALFIFGIAALLNFTDTMTWGTMSLSAPDVEPCRRVINERQEAARISGGSVREPELLQVRWIWSIAEYGWGCYIEWDDFEVETITPMPE